MLVLQKIQRIEERDDVLLSKHLYRARYVGFGSRHQIETHFGDDPHVPLPKQAVDPGTMTPFVVLPGLGVWQCAHSGAHHFAIRQHNFHTAVGSEVITEW
jgi:hypothetical protein